MQQILEMLENKKNWKEFLKKACRKNKVTVDIAAYFTPLKMKAVYQKFETIYAEEDQKNKSCWLQNQLKAFYWTLIAISGEEQKLVQNFSFNQWIQLNEIFKNKNQSIMEYEAIKLVNERISKNRAWEQEQIDILMSIINQNKDSNKWNDIARTLFQLSKNKYFRSGKQCRERWLNHLDPTKKRGDWTEEEDIFIVKHILAQGKRWSTIARQLGSNRTQHMIKNRYKTLLIKQKKITNKVTSQNNLLRQFLKGLNLEVQQPITKRKQKGFDIFQSNNQEMKQENLEDNIEKQQDKLEYMQSILPISPKKIANLKLKNQIESQIIKKEQQKSDVATENFCQNKYDKDPVIAGLIQEYSKPLTQNNYQLQQICSPWYINYQGMTPNYFSPSPSLPFFLNSSFSAFQNPSLFLKNNNMKNDQTESNHKF